MNWINTEDAAHIIETHAINRRPVTYDFVIHAGDGCIMENERTIGYTWMQSSVSIDAARHRPLPKKRRKTEEGGAGNEGKTDGHSRSTATPGS
jgi:hypothetical protein